LAIALLVVDRGIADLIDDWGLGDWIADSLPIGQLVNRQSNRQSDRQSPIDNRRLDRQSPIADKIGNRQSAIANRTVTQ
jgi:hypothetical protein